MRKLVGIVGALLFSLAPAAAQDLDSEFSGALNTLLKQGAEPALPKFTKLVNERWKEMSPKGKHGAANLLMFCQVACGKTEDARKQGAWLYGEMPKAFCSLAQLSGGAAPKDPKLAKLRSSIFLLSLRAGKGSSLLYLHNASSESLTISESKFDVSFGYKTKTTSVGNMSTSGSPVFQGAITLPAGGGTIVQSSKGGGFLAAALPDCVAILACGAKDRLPGWIHLVMDSYSQTLTKVQFTADVTWGKDQLEGAAIVAYDAPAKAEDKKGEAPAKDAPGD